MCSSTPLEARAVSHLWGGPHFREVLGDTAFAILDRTLLSATNFAVGILLIRRASEAEYGLYVLAHSAILLLIGFQNALITTPMSVMAPKQESNERQHFISTLGKTQYLIWLPLCFGLLLVSHFAHYLSLDVATQAIILAVAIVSLSVLLQEFIRHVFFVYMVPQSVLLVDIVYAVIFVGLVYFFTTASSAPAVYTITAMGLAGLLAGICGFLLIRGRNGWKFSWDLSPLAVAWKHGKWALMGVAVTWLHNQGFLYLLSGLMGMVEVGSVSASRLFFMPIPIMLVSVGSILKPRGASWIADGEQRRLFQITGLFTGAAVVVALMYAGVVFFERKRIGYLVFNKEIAEIDSLVALWGAVFVVQIVRSSLSVLFQILERFRVLFYIGTLAAVSSLSLGYWAIQLFGAPGSLVGLIAGELTYVVCMGWVLFEARDWRVGGR